MGVVGKDVALEGPFVASVEPMTKGALDATGFGASRGWFGLAGVAFCGSGAWGGPKAKRELAGRWLDGVEIDGGEVD